MKRRSLPASLRLVLLMVLLPMAVPARAEVTEAELKAAFVFNLTKFVEWPAEALAAAPDSLNVCLLGGRDAFFDAIHELRGKQVKGLIFAVRGIDRGDAARGCQVLVVADREVEQLPAVLKRSDSPALLTVGNSARFLDSGGIVGLAIENSKLRFDVDLAAARRANLVISSNLLRLARQVRQ